MINARPLRRLATITFRAALLAAAATAVLAAPATARAEGKKLVGRWLAVSVEIDGAAVPAETLPELGIGLEFTEKTVSYLEMGKPVNDAAHEYTVDTSKDPHELDFKEKRGVNKALFKFDGEKLVVVMARAGGKDRPAKFATAKGDGLILMTLKKAE